MRRSSLRHSPRPRRLLRREAPQGCRAVPGTIGRALTRRRAVNLKNYPFGESCKTELAPMVPLLRAIQFRIGTSAPAYI